MIGAHTVPLRFSQPRIIESFRKSRPLQLLKHILELGRFGSFVILGILEIRPSWGSFGTFGTFEEYLLRARSARYLRAYVGRPCHPSCLPDDRCVFSDAWDHLVASQTTTRALSSLNRLLVSIKLLGGPPPAAAFGSFGSFGILHVCSPKTMPGQHFGTFGRGRRQPTIFGLRGTLYGAR